MRGEIIKDYPNYIIFENGTIINKKYNNFIKPIKAQTGYLCVNLYNKEGTKMKKIHRLLGEHFIENPNNYPVIDHINRDRADNRLNNLRWCTYSENSLNCKLRVDNKLKEKNIHKNKFGHFVVKMKRNNIMYYKTCKTLEEAKIIRNNIEIMCKK